MPAYNRQLKDEDDNIIYPIINDGSLQNGSVTTNKIADGAVAAGKIDFSTFVIQSGSVPAGENTLSLTPGKWLIFAYISLQNPTDGATRNLRLAINNAVTVATFSGNTNTAEWENLCLFDYITVAANDVVKLIAEASSTPATRSKYIAIKLGV